ncbi:phage major capsid protein [Myroides pelagicus]|uniref:Phage major capsid protein n=1 Tax=Myroides pelagicus TaxID=270914 RepID=A0A7K1GIP0_9FLAO|nr:phage major capsid protein [Myroides pelagicus]MTH28409.1 phage major capsid protein [Myroides pelagicus]
MKKSDILKQQRMAKLQAQKKIVDAAETANRGFTPEEQTQIDAMDEEVEALDAEIERELANEARQLRFAQTLGSAGGSSTSEEREMGEMSQRYSFLTAARAASRGVALTGVEKEMNDEALREAGTLSLTFNNTERSFSIPSTMVRATTQTVGQDGGQFGGTLVTQENRIVDGFIPKLFLEEAGATMMTGLVGNVGLPKFSEYEYKWLDELEEIVLEAEKVGGPVMKPKRAGAGISISNQLLLQTSEGVENIIYNKLRGASGRALNQAALNGAGGKAPLGLLNMPGVQLAKAVAEEELTHEAIVELWKLVASSNANVGNATYIMNSLLAGAAMVAKKDAGSGRFLMEGGMMNGSKTIVTNLVETLAGTQPLIYGDFSELFIGQWGGVNFVADPITGAGSAQVKLYSNLYADVQCANPEAFAVNKFLKG